MDAKYKPSTKVTKAQQKIKDNYTSQANKGPYKNIQLKKVIERKGKKPLKVFKVND